MKLKFESSIQLTSISISIYISTRTGVPGVNSYYEGEGERKSKGERFRFTAENAVILLTFFSSIKRNEHYQNQIYGKRTPKLLHEQFQSFNCSCNNLGVRFP